MGTEHLGSFDCLNELVRQVGGCAVKDGGFATQLENHGASLDNQLWSAFALISDPDLILKVHREYFEAGAEVVVTSSYQGTLQRFEARGLSRQEAEALLQKSVQLACKARREFMDNYQKLNSFAAPIKPLVAASIGSYGAYLADGSEYSGHYGSSMSLSDLKDFHRRRIQVLANSEADMLAIETIPCKIEAQAFMELLEEEDVKIPSWLCFNSTDGVNIASGDSLLQSVALIDKCDKIVAVGVNCTAPQHIQGLISSIQKATSKLVVAYPNSGEVYDGKTKKWMPCTGVSDSNFASYVCQWRKAGASIIGGCCRTTPDTVRAIIKALNGEI